MIKITDAAAAQIRVAANNPDTFDMVLRVAGPRAIPCRRYPGYWPPRESGQQRHR